VEEEGRKDEEPEEEAKEDTLSEESE